MAFNTGTNEALKLSINLSGIVSGGVEAVTAVRKRERSLAEARFQQAVIDEQLSYDAQIQYRKEQIEQEKRKASPDADYISTLEGSVREIRKLNRYKKIREDYLQNYDRLQAGKISLEDHKQFLERQLSSAPDEDSRTEIRNELSKVRGQIAQEQINVLKNRAAIAEKDGTVNVLQRTIDDIARRKAFAELNGNEEEATSWDVTLTSLRMQLNQTNIQNAAHDIDLRISQRGATPLEKLDILQREINNADSSTPVVVNNVTYTSERAYWESTRSDFIAGTGSLPNFQSFFNELEQSVKDKIDTVSRINPYGFVPVPTLEAIQNDYNQLSTRPEFAVNETRLNASRSAALAYGVDKSAEALTASSVETLQLNSGLDTLSSLESKFGIDLSAQKASLNQQIIQKGGQLSGIKEATEQLGKVGAETPSGEVPDNLTPGGIFQSNRQPVKPQQPATTQPAATPAAPAAPATPQNNFREIVIQSGETLSGIAQRELGSSAKYKDIASFNNISDPNKIQAGAKLKIPV